MSGRRWWPWWGVAVALAVAGLWGFLAWGELREAERLASSAAGRVPAVMREASAGDLAGAHEVVGKAAAELDRASLRFGSPWVRPLTIVPLIGGEVRAARAGVTAARESLAAVDDLVGFFVESDRPALFRAGELRTEGLEALHERLEGASQHAAAARRAVEDAPVPRMPAVRRELEELDERSRLLAQALAGASSLVERLHLATSGGQSYRVLVLFENGAELRATGGIVGFLGLLEVGNGHIDLVRSEVVHDLRLQDDSGEYVEVAAPDDYLDRYGRYQANTTLWLNVNLSPHFPDVAQVARDLYSTATGIEADTVVRIDLVALGYLADVFRLEVDGQAVDGDSLATDFLIESYLRFPGQEEHGEYLGQVVGEAFDQVLSGDGGDPARLAAALRRSVAERRLSAVTWDPDVDSLLAQLGADGSLLPGEPGDVEVVVQNFGGNKLDLFTEQEMSVEVTGEGCTVQPRLTLRLTNRAPEQAASFPAAFPKDPLGGTWWVSVYLPREGHLSEISVDGEQPKGSQHVEAGRPVVATVLQAAPGETATLEVGWWEEVSEPRYRLRLRPQPLVHPSLLSLEGEEPEEFRREVETEYPVPCGSA